MPWRRIVDGFWHDRKVRRLDPLGKLLLLYLVTSPDSHVTGLFRWDPAVAARRMGCDRGVVGELMGSLRGIGLVQEDSECGLVYVPRMFKYQGSRSPKMRTYVYKHLERLPPCPLVTSFKRAYLWKRADRPKHGDTLSDTVS